MQRELCRYPGRENPERCAFGFTSFGDVLDWCLTLINRLAASCAPRRDRQTSGAACTSTLGLGAASSSTARHARITESDDAASAGAPFPPGSAATILRLRISLAASAAGGPTG